MRGFERRDLRPAPQRLTRGSSPAVPPACHSYTLVQDKEALSETVANVRWLIAAGIRDF